MEKKRNGEFRTSLKISTSFKVFLVIFLLSALGIIGYSLYRQGKCWSAIFNLVLGVIFGLGIVYWFIGVALKRLLNLTNLSEQEQSYVDDLKSFKLTEFIKKYIFSDLDIRDVLNFIIILGYVVKWLLFYIFTVGSLIVLCKDDTLLDKMMMISLAVTWCPWVENILLKKINYKIIFILKLLITMMVFFIAIRGGS